MVPVKTLETLVSFVQRYFDSEFGLPGSSAQSSQVENREQKLICLKALGFVNEDTRILPDTILCQVLNTNQTTLLVTRTHIYPRKWLKNAKIIKVNVTDIDGPENTLFMFFPFENNMDSGRLYLYYDDNDILKIRILDPLLNAIDVCEEGMIFFQLDLDLAIRLKPTASEKSQLTWPAKGVTFGQFDGQPIHFIDGNTTRPRKRFIQFLGLRIRMEGVKRGLCDDVETPDFPNYGTWSDGVSNLELDDTVLRWRQNVVAE